MYENDLMAVGAASRSKVDLYEKNKVGYLISSMFAGLFVGLGIMLIFSIGGLLTSGGSAGTKVVMGASFGVALSLVIFAGAELFTGNNFVMAIGLVRGDVNTLGVIKVFVASYIGNLLGSVLGAFLFVQAGLSKGPIGEFIAKGALGKMTISSGELFVRGILCNILVCLAIWCSFKMKNEVGKLIMVFWCLFVFITAGFEHSVANMTLLSIGLFAKNGLALTFGGFVHNLLWVTLGNMVGGILLALGYTKIGNKN